MCISIEMKQLGSLSTVSGPSFVDKKVFAKNIILRQFKEVKSAKHFQPSNTLVKIVRCSYCWTGFLVAKTELLWLFLVED